MNLAIDTARPSISDKEPALRPMLKRIIGHSGKGHRQIASELTTRTGRIVTVFAVNCWTAETKKKYRFPAALVEDFCAVVGNDELKGFIVGDQFRSDAEIGAICRKVLSLESMKLLLKLERSKAKGKRAIRCSVARHNGTRNGVSRKRLNSTRDCGRCGHE